MCNTTTPFSVHAFLLIPQQVLRDEQIELVTNTKVPGGFAWGQGVLYELGLGGGEVSGLSTKIRMNLSINWTKEVRQSRLLSKTGHSCERFRP